MKSLALIFMVVFSATVMAEKNFDDTFYNLEVSKDAQAKYLKVVNKEIDKLIPHTSMERDKVIVLFRHSTNNLIEYAEITCNDKLDGGTIIFDEYSIMLMFSKGDDFVGPIMAHELSHCKVDKYFIDEVPGVCNKQQHVELEADRIGLDLYIQSGGSADKYLETFKVIDLPKDDSHPSDMYRYKYLRNYLRTGEKIPKPYKDYK